VEDFVGNDNSGRPAHRARGGGDGDHHGDERCRRNEIRDCDHYGGGAFGELGFRFSGGFLDSDRWLATIHGCRARNCHQQSRYLEDFGGNDFRHRIAHGTDNERYSYRYRDQRCRYDEGGDGDGYGCGADREFRQRYAGDGIDPDERDDAVQRHGERECDEQGGDVVRVFGNDYECGPVHRGGYGSECDNHGHERGGCDEIGVCDGYGQCPDGEFDYGDANDRRGADRRGDAVECYRSGNGYEQDGYVEDVGRGD